jgi:hypothetical protein
LSSHSSPKLFLLNLAITGIFFRAKPVMSDAEGRQDFFLFSPAWASFAPLRDKVFSSFS